MQIPSEDCDSMLAGNKLLHIGESCGVLNISSSTHLEPGLSLGV